MKYPTGPISFCHAISALLLLILAPAAGRADDKYGRAFQPRVFAGAQGGALPYGLFVPKNLDHTKRYPLILFLHGSGERGSDNRRQLRDMQPWTADDIQARYPCFIVAPQCPNWREVFQVYGRNTDLAITTYNNYAGSERAWKRYQIAAGKQISGKTNWMFFFNDDWAKETLIDSAFRNVKVYEIGQAARAKAVDFRNATLTPYARGGRGNNPTVEDNGATLHLVGDTRKKIPFPYAVTKNTVIEFDFRSTMQGNVHGIGLDEDDQILEYQWVQVPWGDTAHTMSKAPSVPMKLVMEMLPALQKEFPSIDSSRLYMTGLSMGGFGVWDLLARRPDWFAAAVPICGGADLETANTVAPIPIWDFHGAQDGTVRADRSRTMIAALWNIGSEPRYTEYQGVGHDAWKRAYAEPELLPWLFRQRRDATPPTAPGTVKAGVVGASRVDLSWLPSHDAESGMKEYRVLRDEGEIAVTTQTRFADTEVGEGEVHSYSIVAMNGAWLKSPPSAKIWARLPTETMPLRVLAVQAQGSPFIAEVHFDKPVDPKTGVEPANYTIDHGLTVNSAVVLPDQKTVRLETSGHMAKTEYTLSVSNVAERSRRPNVIAPSTKAKYVFDPCLAAHWRLNEGEGAFSADATGNGSGAGGNVITFRSVDWTPGKWGKALSFDGGQGHYAWTVQSRSLDLTDAVTVSLWVKKATGLYGHQILIAKSNYYDRRTQFMLDFDPSHRLRATVGTLDKGEVAVTGRRIDARDWHHVALTFGSSTLELFIDGESQGKMSGGDRLMSVSEAITVGAGHQGRDPMCGALDEIRVYNRCLSAQEIKALAAATME